MKIGYLTLEQYELLVGKFYNEYCTFSPLQDDETHQYYITEQNIIDTNVFELLWVRELELVDLPEYEYYKFKYPDGSSMF